MPDTIKKQNSDGAYATKMKRVFENPYVEKFQTRKIRRSLVFGMLAWFVTTNLVAMKFPGLIWVWGLMFLGFFPLMSMINMSVRGVTEIPLKALDERQGQLKSKSYMQAYIIGVVAAALLGFAFARFNTLGMVSFPLFAGGPGMIIALPAMLLAWNLPDELDDEA